MTNSVGGVTTTMLDTASGPTREILGVTVVDGPTPAPWDAAVVRGNSLWADHDRLLLRTVGAAVYIAEGRTIVLETDDPGDRFHFDQLVYATSARVVLTQRRRFSLHATLVVAPTGRAVAITGEGMSGKSTTTIELVRRGWTFSCDDILEIELVDGSPVAVPLARPVHLSDAAADRLRGDTTVGRLLPGGTKRAYAMAGDLTPRPLSGVYRLGTSETDDVTCEVVPPLQALSIIGHHGDPYGVCQLPEVRASYLSWTAAIVSHAPVFELQRPMEGDSVEQVADLIERG